MNLGIENRSEFWKLDLNSEGWLAGNFMPHGAPAVRKDKDGKRHFVIWNAYQLHGDVGERMGLTRKMSTGAKVRRSGGQPKALRAIYDCVDEEGLSDPDIEHRAYRILSFIRKIIENLKKAKAEAKKATEESEPAVNNDTNTSPSARNPESSGKDRAPSQEPHDDGESNESFNLSSETASQTTADSKVAQSDTGRETWKLGSESERMVASDHESE
ncbi:hypothetical protein HO173_005819 [Letharia columbiana]|uniref:Uncharacterized protein n=1 Tax=Letharia columbiana TaxID=112416 RepID=A0A8H6FWM5_9LECA|nr:uncharacterized protein HO173_005819 [Letharia columbiana]KAF6236190.1 hypothetical protein HO173_005819 [Letharia columbiana]